MCVCMCVCARWKKLIFGKKVSWLKWDSNPRPKTSALNWRLRPLGHPATCWLQMMTASQKQWIHITTLMYFPQVGKTSCTLKKQSQTKCLYLQQLRNQYHWKQTNENEKCRFKSQIIISDKPYSWRLEISLSQVCINESANQFQLFSTPRMRLLISVPCVNSWKNQPKKGKN